MIGRQAAARLRLFHALDSWTNPHCPILARRGSGVNDETDSPGPGDESQVSIKVLELPIHAAIADVSDRLWTRKRSTKSLNLKLHRSVTALQEPDLGAEVVSVCSLAWQTELADDFTVWNPLRMRFKDSLPIRAVLKRSIVNPECKSFRICRRPAPRESLMAIRPTSLRRLG